MSLNQSEANGGIPYLLVSYLQELSTDQTNEILSKSMRLLLDRLSPAGWEAAGLVIAGHIASNDFRSLCSYSPDILDLCHTDQAIIRQCLAFFGKRKDIDLGVDREAAAVQKFWAAERACALTNSTFRAWSQGRFQFRPFVEQVLHLSQRKISKLLGKAPSLAEIRSRFGPGATTQTPKKNACPVVKLSSMPACSANFTDAARAAGLVFTTDSEGGVWLDLPVHNAKLAFADKNALTQRAICTEPALNGMFQAGLGELMASALKRIGIDIKDQSANQRAALYGSISGESATLDLSSASDTIALLLVEHLLPEDWYALIYQLRSAEMQYKGEVHRLEKVSSMGNGFTFPLETIIFWAISQSVVEALRLETRVRTLTYGDDIIVDTRAAVPLMGVLRDLGFTPNPDKSFWTGDFRESCGKDYVFGHDVRPVYVKDRLTGADFFRLHNFFAGKGDFSLAKSFELWIDPTIRLYGPKGLGDGHLHRENWPAKPATAKGFGGYSFQTWSTRPRQLKRDIAERIRRQITFTPKVWDPSGGVWRAGKTKVRAVEYHPQLAFLVRKLATYTQYLRENEPVTYGRTDKWQNSFDRRHVYADRRMPNPREPRTDDDFFVVPGEGKVVRTSVYIFEPPSA